MSLSKLPVECLNKILNFLDKENLYKCLLVNRYYCRITVPLIWRDPFVKHVSISISCSLISTLIACLEGDDILSLIPSTLSFYTKPTLFDYGAFIRKINHDCFAEHVKTLLEFSGGNSNPNIRVQKFIDAIYQMIIQKSSILQEFEVNITHRSCVNLPRASTFTNYEPGFKNLKSLTIFNLDLIIDEARLQNTTEFLNIISQNCNCIDNFELWIKSFNSAFANQYLDIIKTQPLKKLLIYLDNPGNVPFNLGLEHRSETLKELTLDSIDFQQFDLSFISKLECLENLEFLYCKGFSHCKDLSRTKLRLKEFKLWYCSTGMFMGEIIKYFCSASLLKLTLSNVNPRAARAVKEICPNINFLCIRFHSRIFTDSIIPLICELSSLRVLNVGSNFGIDMSPLVKNLADHLVFVEYLYFDFNVDLQSFIYFTNNCKAVLKKWIITLDNSSSSKEYLLYVNKFQKVHNSLKAFGIKKYGYSLMNEETEVIDILKDQGIDLIASDEMDFLFH
ncbi:hypothetical protein RclHR1_04170008 [Rhizophagus clarus]|uniref:F-box domain-containing protein n=1 Tax=Rhizophagus clarus TaxID=94130 RepID=A0A2Z6RK01_9GLOM|nr:hypothetical protein RclHR1_04170008 [Rhizophagus clarus]GES76412.1 hypothetical protein GLOIN_2v1784777 [Rhizophagus clarus]